MVYEETGGNHYDQIVCGSDALARALGWESWLGTLEPGKVADLVVVSGNPLRNMRLLADRRNIKLVLKNGQIVAQPAASSLRDIPEALLAGVWICCGLPVPEHYA